MPTVASATVAKDPIEFAFVSTHLGLNAWVLPTNPAQTTFKFPASNTRQIVILNTGGNPLLFGFKTYDTESVLPSSAVIGTAEPYAFNVLQYTTAAGGAIVPVEGDNCARIPIGASLTIDLRSFQERGSMSPIPNNPVSAAFAPLSYPVYLLFFSSIGGDTTADITYVNTFGIF
jgi:hypothetical protein